MKKMKVQILFVVVLLGNIVPMQAMMQRYFGARAGAAAYRARYGSTKPQLPATVTSDSWLVAKFKNVRNFFSDWFTSASTRSRDAERAYQAEKMKIANKKIAEETERINKELQEKTKEDIAKATKAIEENYWKEVEKSRAEAARK